MRSISETTVSTQLGEFTIRCSERGVRELSFGPARKRAKSRSGEAPGHARNDARKEASLAARWAFRAAQEIKEYAAGERQEFTVPLDIEGTLFQKKVWSALRTIPYGQTRSYGEIARQVGNPRAARAVGMANHDNPIAIIVPCHRVIAGDGSLGGYAGGLRRKSRILRLEQSRR